MDRYFGWCKRQAVTLHERGEMTAYWTAREELKRERDQYQTFTAG